MCLRIKKAITISCFLIGALLYSQNTKRNNDLLELGGIIAGDETLFYGGYTKFIKPLSQNKHHFTLGISLTVYFDFKGESEPDAFLKNDIDMRFIPNINLGYSLNFNKVQLNFEIPVGMNLAWAKGTLVNERIGFERDFSNKEVFFNYGLSFTPKYRINNANSIGLFGFLPWVRDTAQSGYQIGVGWTRIFDNKL